MKKNIATVSFYALGIFLALVIFLRFFFTAQQEITANPQPKSIYSRPSHYVTHHNIAGNNNQKYAEKDHNDQPNPQSKNDLTTQNSVTSKEAGGSTQTIPLPQRENTFESKKLELKNYIRDFSGRLASFGKLNSSLEYIYINEKRNETWAVAIEKDIYAAAAKTNGMIIKYIDCKTSLCRIEINIENTGDTIPSLQSNKYFLKLGEINEKNIISYGVIEKTHMQVFRGYLLNLDEIDAYIEAFRDQYNSLQKAK